MLTPTTVAVVAIGALVVFGPKKLPELARALGKSLSEFKAGAEEARDTFQRELNQSPSTPSTPSAPAAPEAAVESKPDQPSA